MKGIHSFFKTLFVIIIVFILTYAYALYERKKVYVYENNYSNDLVLKSLPIFTTIDYKTNLPIGSQAFLAGSNGIFVHIWGTWCAPCEKEMPDFLTFAKILENRGIKFLLVAVNDDMVKVKKFLQRFPKIPSNVTITLDRENKVMDLFGTLKVPETFLFNFNGVHVNKFVGPQEWLQESYLSRLDIWLGNANPSERKIETH